MHEILAEHRVGSLSMRVLEMELAKEVRLVVVLSAGQTLDAISH